MIKITESVEIKTRRYNIAPADLKISPDMVAEMMGFEDEPAPEPFPELIEQELVRLPEYVHITGGYRIFPVAMKDNISVSVNGEQFYLGRTVGKLLAGSEQIAVYVCTAGQKVSDRITGLSNSGMINESYITDVIGSMIVEAAMDHIRDILKEEMANVGMKITNRYSPGYCDWDIAEQNKLFSLLPEGFCGVSLTDSSLMVPVKSVSGFIGIGKDVKFNAYVCELCNIKHCMYRRRASKRASSSSA